MYIVYFIFDVRSYRLELSIEVSTSRIGEVLQKVRFRASFLKKVRLFFIKILLIVIIYDNVIASYSSTGAVSLEQEKL